MASYYISKVLYQRSQKIIESVEIYPLINNYLGKPNEIARNTLIRYLQYGDSVATMTKGENGKWQQLHKVNLHRGGFIKGLDTSNLHDDLGNIPLLLTKRKTFISFYHKDDEEFRQKFENLTDDLIVNKSVIIGDIDADNSDEYVKQLIQKEYLSETTVLMVLVGTKTKCRKHVDWEISGALDLKVGEHYAGLIGILLPTHPDYGVGKKYKSENLPKRLAENAKSGYAKIYDWTYDRVKIQIMLEDAFGARKLRADKRVNKSIKQMQEDTCD